MRLEAGAFFGEHAAIAEAEDLIAAAVGQDWLGPVHEAMQAAAPGNQVVAGAEIQMIGIAEDDLRASVLQIARGDGFDRGARADGHEDRRFNRPMSCLQHAGAGGAVAMGDSESETGIDHVWNKIDDRQPSCKRRRSSRCAVVRIVAQIWIESRIGFE